MKWLSLEQDEISFNKETDPCGWLQFKGTDICMDVYCKCGHRSHIDGDFIYFLKCPLCGTIYELNGFIQLIERDPKEVDTKVHIPQN